MRRDTPQLLDPLGGLTAKFFARFSGITALLVATALAIARSDEVQSPPLQGAALVLLLCAVGLLIDGTSARRFPFSVVRHAAIHALALAAIALDSASRAEHVGHPAGWGSVCLAILLVMMGSFRPSSEIIVFSVVSTLVTATIWTVHFGSLSAESATTVIGTAWPIFAVGLGAAALSRVLVARLLAWREASTANLERERESLRAALIPEVVEHRHRLVEYRVEPFLRRLLAEQYLTPTDAATARGLANTMRKSMLGDADGTWLTTLVSHVNDEQRLAEHMSTQQRAALGALLTELRAVHLQATITRDGDVANATFVAELTPHHTLRADGYLAVLRTYFDRATLTVSPDSPVVEVSLRFVI